MLKQILYSLSIVGLIFLASNTLAQNKQKGGVPYGFIVPEISNEIVCSQHSPSISIENLLLQDSENDDKDGSPMRFAVSIPISLTVSVDNVKVLEKGIIVWQRRIVSDNAQAISLIFNEFVIPKNGKLFIYTPDGETTLGYFDHESSTYNNPFVTQFLPGDEVLVEYSEESSSLEDFASHASIKINEIVYAYRGFNRFSKDIGDSGPCEVNINCPEGNNWQQQKRGVAKMYFKNGSSWYNCSGSLVNNTSNDGTSYFLTADHCGGDASEEDRSVWQFYFQFERPNCSNSEEPISSSFVTGCSLVSSAPMSGGSDFQLLLLSEEIPRSFLPYYNGWDRSTTASKSGVTIHHPQGDVKKISTYTRTLTTTTPNIGGSVMAIYSAWRVYWTSTETNFGVTEKGSSGSPLFTTNGLVIGTLSGGNSACTNLTEADFYGKFNYHWQSNGENDNERLSPWLDPIESNPTALNGFDPLVPRNLNADVESNIVALTWDDPLITSDLSGFNIYCDDVLEGQVAVGTNNYSIDYNLRAQITIHITALYSSPEYESEPSNSETVTVETASSTSDFPNNFLNIYPNPAKDAFTLESHWPMASIKIYTLNGQMIKSINEEIGFSKTIYATQMPKGIYLVDVIAVNGSRQVLKLVIEP